MGVALRGCADFCVGDRLDALPASRGRDEPTPAVVWSENAMVAGEVDPRLWYQGGQAGNDKSAGEPI